MSLAALRATAAAAQARADYPALERAGRELVASGEASGDREALAWGHHYLGVARMRFNDGITAKRELVAARALFEALDDAPSASRSLMNLAVVEFALNVDVVAARAYFDAAMPAVRATRDKIRIARALGNLGEIERLDGNYRAATDAATQSLAIFHELGDWARAAWQLTNLAHLQLLARDYGTAMASLRLAYEALQRDPVEKWVAWWADVCFIVAAKLNRWETAAQFLGYADRVRDRHNVPRSQVMLPWLSEPKERVMRAFPSDRLEELLQQGEALTLQYAGALVETLASEA